jgi:hypothetical protein
MRLLKRTVTRIQRRRRSKEKRLPNRGNGAIQKNKKPGCNRYIVKCTACISGRKKGEDQGGEKGGLVSQTRKLEWVQVVGVEGFVQDQQTIVSGRHLACVRDRRVSVQGPRGVVVIGPKLSRSEKGEEGARCHGENWRRESIT